MLSKVVWYPYLTKRLPAQVNPVKVLFGSNSALFSYGLYLVSAYQAYQTPS